MASGDVALSTGSVPSFIIRVGRELRVTLNISPFSLNLGQVVRSGWLGCQQGDGVFCSEVVLGRKDKKWKGSVFFSMCVLC